MRLCIAASVICGFLAGCVTLVKPSPDPPQTLQLSGGEARLGELPSDPQLQILVKNYYQLLLEDRAAKRELKFACENLGESSQRVAPGWQIALAAIDMVCLGFWGFTFPDRYRVDYRINLNVADALTHAHHEIPGKVYHVDGELRGLMGWRLMGWNRLKNMVQLRAKGNALHQRMRNLDRDLAGLLAPSMPAEPSGIVIVPPAEQPTEPVAGRTGFSLGKRRQIALIIGIDAYKEFKHLKNAVADARAVAQVLRDQYGFSQLIELYDDDATRANIHAAVQSLVQSLQGGEDVLIYFAGHGWRDLTLDRGYWVPVDAREGHETDYVPNSDFHDFIKTMDKRKVGHVLVVADSCFSGTFLDVPRSVVVVRPAQAKGPGPTKYLGDLYASPSRHALTSGGNQPVPDGGEEGHSAFARSLLRALEQPEYPAFTATELAVRVQRSVATNADQTPWFGIIKYVGHESGEFVFVKQK